MINSTLLDQLTQKYENFPYNNLNIQLTPKQ